MNPFSARGTGPHRPCVARSMLVAGIRASGVRGAGRSGHRVVLALLLAAASTAATAASWPPVAELSEKLRLALPSLPVPDPSVTQAESYVRSLTPWVLPPPADEPPRPVGLAKTNLYSGGAAYLRVGTVSTNLPRQLASARDAVLKQGPVSGWVLDLRFAEGTDHGAAVETASQWAAKEALAYRLGSDLWRVHPSSQAPATPVVVLVNHHTRQAAETLALAVRQSAARTVVVGTNTAGQARSYRALPVSEDLTLRVSADPLLLPDGSPFPADGLAPDVLVEVSEEDERAYAVNEFLRVWQGRPLAAASQGRLNEAELVRRRRVPRDPFDEAHGRAPGRVRGPRPAEDDGGGDPSSSGRSVMVQDPALAVALDLIAGAAEAAEQDAEGSSAFRESR